MATVERTELLTPHDTQFMEETDGVSGLVFQTLKGIERFNMASSFPDASTSDLCRDVEDCLKRLDELFSDADEERQSAIVSAFLSARPSSLQDFYTFAEKIFSGRSK